MIIKGNVNHLSPVNTAGPIMALLRQKLAHFRHVYRVMPIFFWSNQLPIQQLGLAKDPRTTNSAEAIYSQNLLVLLRFSESSGSKSRSVNWLDISIVFFRSPS